MEATVIYLLKKYNTPDYILQESWIHHCIQIVNRIMIYRHLRYITIDIIYC